MRSVETTTLALIAKYPNWRFRANLGLQKIAKMVGLKYRRSQTGPKNPNKSINIVVITTWGPWLKKNEIAAYLQLYWGFVK